MESGLSSTPPERRRGHLAGSPSPRGYRPPPPSPELPKGLSSHTLQLVEKALRDADRELSAGEAARLCGLSRVSTRRYLEHLATRGLAQVRPRYGSAGRPEHGYRWIGAD